MKKLLLLLYVLVPIILQAAPYHGKIMSFKQPDGSLVDVKLFGSEQYMRAEGLDGYTLIRDKETGWICYAVLSADDKLVSAGIVYRGKSGDATSLKSGLPFPKHMDISEKSRLKNEEIKRKQLGLNTNNANTKTQWNPVSGNIKGLCIVVDFSDETGSLPMSEFSDFCNNINYSNYANNGSLRTYYSDISGGVVDYENVVYGYYRAPLSFAEYDAMPYAVGAQEILGLALNWIESTGFDFSTLSINPDGTIMAINLMYTGYAQNWAEGMWWHMGTYSGFTADGVSSGSYNCSPANYPLALGTVCHENGHMIGKWPDTYKYSSDTGPDGIGYFDLMCYVGFENNPVPPNPHFWSNAGWGNVVDVTYYNGINNDTCNNLTCYKYVNTADTNEFFLLENMRNVGRYESIPDEGLTIWHIDRNGDNQTMHHEVYLEHANNDIENQYDACFHSSFNTEFSNTTTPASGFYSGSPSGLRVWEIGPVSNNMTYKLGAGTAAPTFSLSYVNFTGDANSNGFIEPGETGDVNITASNFGQLSSATATITCTATGANSGYVTINTPTINAGIINVMQTINAAHNITLSSGTPLGTVIALTFLISDGTYSATINKQFVVGYQIVMDDQQITNCSSVFYDPGGFASVYQNMTDFTTTIFPEEAGKKVQVDFTFMDIEQFSGCVYDYLKIYNGPSTTSPLIGTYCGSASPGIVTSTNATGALTFKFHSDESVAGNGWEAIVSCVWPTQINETENKILARIFPNPSTGLFSVNINSMSAELSVFNILGEEVLFMKHTGEQNPVIDLSGKAEGIYYVRIKTDNDIATYTLLLERE